MKIAVNNIITWKNSDMFSLDCSVKYSNIPDGHVIGLRTERSFRSLYFLSFFSFSQLNLSVLFSALYNLLWLNNRFFGFFLTEFVERIVHTSSFSDEREIEHFTRTILSKCVRPILQLSNQDSRCRIYFSKVWNVGIDIYLGADSNSRIQFRFPYQVI